MNKLTVKWSKQTKDFIYDWPAGGSKRDSRLIHNMLFGLVGGTDVIAELKRRGYDVSTLRLSIELKAKDD